MTTEAPSLTCSSCGTSLSVNQAVQIKGKRKSDPNIVLCTICADKVEQAFQAETEDANLPAAALLGLFAAVLSALIWYGIVVVADYQLGIIAIAVGWLVAQGVMLGAGRKRGPFLQAISVIITIGAMAASEYLIVRHILIQLAVEEGYFVNDVPLLLPLEDIWFLIIEGIKADPITLVFWAIALWEAFSLPAKKRLRKIG